jgi:hypothetical protein
MLRYLKHTLFHDLLIRRNSPAQLHAYFDADWAAALMTDDPPRATASSSASTLSPGAHGNKLLFHVQVPKLDTGH